VTSPLGSPRRAEEMPAALREGLDKATRFDGTILRVRSRTSQRQVVRDG
jgi:hypothetical protein